LITSNISKARIKGKIITTDIWDIKKLEANLATGTDHVAIDIDFNTDEYMRFKIPFIKMQSSEFSYQCVIALFPGKLLYHLYEEYNTRLLSNNVRYFLGFKGSKKRNANQGILDTLRNEHQKFLAYNNGITALAASIESTSNGEEIDISDSERQSGNDFISTGLLSAIRDFRIVNGGQTTASIFSAKFNNSKNIDLTGVYVQVKIVVMPTDYDKMASDITRYSNSQSSIKYADFTISNKFNVGLESLSRKTLIPNPNKNPLYWYFERVRGQYDQDRKTIKSQEDQRYFESKYPKQYKFKKEEYAKVWNCWLCRPYDAVKGEGTSYELFIKDKQNDEPDELFYHQTIALMIIYRFLLQRQETKRYGNRKATICAYALAFLNFRTRGMLDLEKIWLKQDISDNLKMYLNQLCELIYDTTEKLAGNMGVLSWGKRKSSFNELCACVLKDNRILLDEEIEKA
jgi:hypothetical protein